MPAPLVEVGSTNPNGTVKPILTLNQQIVTTGLWGLNGYASGFGSSVTLLASGSQPGVLNPGEDIKVPIYYCGLLQPWDFTQSSVQLGTAVVEASDSDPMNWTGETYAVVSTYQSWDIPAEIINGKLYPGSAGSSTSFTTQVVPWAGGQAPSTEELTSDLHLQNGFTYDRLIEQSVYARYDEPGLIQLTPPGYTDTAWAAVLSNLESNVGGTLGDYVQALDNNASYLARQGVVDNNIQDLWGLSVLQASDAEPSPALGSTTDVSLPTPGTGLSFSRSFNNTIAGRYSVGPFGQGLG